MRISDWSSDVCSSDLFFLESGVFLVDAYTDAVAQYLGCGRAFDNDFGQGEVLVADFFQELGLRGQVGECGVEAARVQIDLHLVQCFVRLDMQRSEERTSELQALLRISYAVFCFTKKNS